MIGINDVTTCEKSLEAERCTLEQALSIAQRKMNIANESVQIKKRSFSKIYSISTIAAMVLKSTAQYLHIYLNFGGRYKTKTCKFCNAGFLKCHKKVHIARGCKLSAENTPQTSSFCQRNC